MPNDNFRNITFDLKHENLSYVDEKEEGVTNFFPKAPLKGNVQIKAFNEINCLDNSRIQSVYFILTVYSI